MGMTAILATPSILTPVTATAAVTFDVTPLARALKMAQLVILRGLPGSGKSTLAKQLVASHGFAHFEADVHFESTAGYHFDPARVSDAHAWVAREACAALQAGQRVVIANTNVRLWELSQPLGLALLLQVPYVVVECQGQWHNIHDVPEAVIETMRAKWEPLPAYVNQAIWAGEALK
jgi:predicted kinase